MECKNSKKFIQRAQQFLPGGVNSPVRAFKNVNGCPIFIEKAIGAKLFDVDGNEYIDYVGAWGPSILGHANLDVMNSIRAQLDKGIVYGASCELEIDLAEIICNNIPNIDKIRFTNSGTEATMSAIRLARGYTNKELIIKFAGSYHGHYDSLLVKDNYAELGESVFALGGIPKDICDKTLIATYNDLQSVKDLFLKYSTNIAAIIVEPVAGNMNCVPPVDGFLQGLRELCDEYKSLLIFDEVMTGFRVNFKGCQDLYNVNADLITFGKIIGGGLPIGSFGGKKEIMDYIAPQGSIYQGGTFSGNPLAMVAGITTLKKLIELNQYANLNEMTDYLVSGIKNAADFNGISLSTTKVGAMFGLFFSKQQIITNLEDVNNCDRDLFNKFHKHMLENGVYLAPSSFESCFISLAHNYNDLDYTIKIANDFFKGL